MSKPLVFVFVGAKSVGKARLMRRLWKEFPNSYSIIPILTTLRPPERLTNGLPHIHHERDTMLQLIDEGELLAHWKRGDDVFGVSKILLTSYISRSKVTTSFYFLCLYDGRL